MKIIIIKLNCMSGTIKLILPPILLIFVFTLTFLTGCEREDDDPQPEPEPVPLTLTINTDITYQTIAGFGGANRIWGTQFLKPAEAKKAFGTDETDLGMSIFRVRIASNSTEWPLILESVKEAQNYNVKILASPWSPPANLKSNNSIVGGYLLPENYEAFKDYINSFVAYMDANGVNIYAISIQNEPDIEVSYESCDWYVTKMAVFLKNYGHLINGTKIAAPESFNFNKWFTNGLLEDAEAAENLDIVAGHIYGGGLGSFPLAEQKGKEIWMTEYLLNLNTGNSGAPRWTSYEESEIWEESLEMLHTVHEAMINNWNAYIWWYIQRYYSFIGDGTEGTTNGEILKRGYAFSHFSKYIRPGFVRVYESINKQNDLEITAYKGNSQIVIVIINPEDILVSNLNIEVPSVSSASAYETLLDKNREEKAVILSDSTVVLHISPKSITTIVVEK
jgi:glucuronoarabinoxylan endo-1,4-beta-xylanase